MASSTSRSLPALAIFTKPTKKALVSTVVAFVLFATALVLLWSLLNPSAQTVVALFVGGLSIGAADLFGASAKRIGTMLHILCLSGFYCGAWLVVLALDWLLFDLHFMTWMGW